MRIVLVTNWNGIGLETDGRLLEGLLREWGHEVTRQQYDIAPEPPEKGGFVTQYDLAIWLEVFNQHLSALAARNWLIANPEWTKPESVRPIQRHCEKILAKTRDGERALRKVFNNVEYVGFMAEDRQDVSLPRVDHALHCGGNSGFRGTAEVISAWRKYRYWDDRPLPELVVISNSKMVDCTPTPGITFHKRVSDEELRYLQNSCRFHVTPSSYEGYGQALHESQSVGAIILTTGAGPMAELNAPFEVPSHGVKPYNLGELQEVWARDIREMVPEMVSQPNHAIARMSVEARSRFEEGNESFRMAFKRLLEPRVASVATGTTVNTPKPRIALLGNFRPAHSTENDLLWSLRDMGYPTITFQEDEDRTEMILEEAKECVLLIYISTHGWRTPGRMSIDDLWQELRAQKVKTCSFHLDRYFDLNEADGREDRIGTHPFWRTDRVFTADGGNQQRFSDRGVVHEWLPPAVVRRDCYIGEWKKDLAIDVGFVGAEGYHSEYPFRGKLLEFLRSVYGDRFRVFQGYRGRALNDLYSSIRVTVGDSCFGGADYYWSDRVPETLGRGGALLHPACRGLTIPGLVTFRAGDLIELQDRIDWLLENEEVRQNCIRVASKWVKDNETYNNRMHFLLQSMGI